MTPTITKYCETDPKKVIQNLLKYFEDYADYADYAKCPKTKPKPDFIHFEKFRLYLKLEPEKVKKLNYLNNYA